MINLVLRGAIILALIAFGLPASSQVQNGEFTGLITDPSGAVVNQARVLIHNLGTGLHWRCAATKTEFTRAAN